MHTREHNKLVSRAERLSDLRSMAVWLDMLDIAIETTTDMKKALLMSANISDTMRAEYVGRLQGTYNFFKVLAKEAKIELPPKFTEHFTGERPE